MSAPDPHRIGTLGERSLHAALKTWYARPGDRVEEKVGSYWIDICRGAELIEIQTGSFGNMKRKLEKLLPHRPVRVVHPVAIEKWISRTRKDGRTLISRRKSPKRGSVYDLFDELVSLPHLPLDPHFTLEVVLVREEEWRCEDGKGSWRRRGASIRNHVLLEVAQRVVFRGASDFARLLPPDWTGPSTNRELAGMLGIPCTRAARMTYCLARMGVIRRTGKRGHAFLFAP